MRTSPVYHQLGWLGQLAFGWGRLASVGSPIDPNRHPTDALLAVPTLPPPYFEAAEFISGLGFAQFQNLGLLQG